MAHLILKLSHKIQGSVYAVIAMCLEMKALGMTDAEIIEAQMKERKEKFVMVELLVVNEKYQGKGYMRPLMEFAIETADRYKLPLIIDTDEGVKRDKYCHLGVHQVTGRDFGDSRYSYGMIRECGR